MAVVGLSMTLRLRRMVTRTRLLAGTGSVMRPDGLVIDSVGYVISVHAPWHSRSLDLGAGRLRVPRSEALYWFLESGPGLQLSVEGGRILQFEANGAPDSSGWIAISAGRPGA